MEFRFQLSFALGMAAVYCLIQMLVLVGIIVTMVEKGLCHPTTVFFLFVAGTFILGGILHPQEIFCVVHGCTYFLAIPTMYVILIIYAFCNLHDISWGTREVKKTASEVKADEQRKVLEELARMEMDQGKSRGLFGGMMDRLKRKRDCRCGNSLNIACCSEQESSDPEAMQVLVATVQSMDRSLTQVLEVIGHETEVIDPEGLASTSILTNLSAARGARKQQLEEDVSPKLKRHNMKEETEEGEKKENDETRKLKDEEGESSQSYSQGPTHQREEVEKNKKKEEDRSSESVEDGGISGFQFPSFEFFLLHGIIIYYPLHQARFLPVRCPL